MEFNVQVKVDGQVSFVINADSLEEALQVGRKKLGKLKVYNDNLEVIDSEETITGIY